MNKIELAIDACEVLAPIAKKVFEETAEVLCKSNIGRAAVAEIKVATATFKFGGKSIVEKASKDLIPELKTSDHLPLFRISELPRPLEFDQHFRTNGGTAIYRTLNDGRINLEIPSMQEIAHSPLDELSRLLERNQTQLLHAVEAAKPGHLPTLGWHGTSEAGEKFLWDQRKSVSFLSGEASPLWMTTSDISATQPSLYLSDVQHAIRGSSRFTPGPADSLKNHAIFVVDTSKSETWNWDFRSNQYRQNVLDLQNSESDSTIANYIGNSSGFVGRMMVDITPGNFADRILGSFKNPVRSLAGISRNYFDKWKFERETVSGIFGLQEDTAQSFDLAGILARTR